MIEILNQEELKKKKVGGKPNILSLEDRLDLLHNPQFSS
jgi:hypothetical protein